MATADVYVRVQVKSSNEQVRSVAAAVASLKAAVEATGSEWRGEVQTELDPVPVNVTVLLDGKAITEAAVTTNKKRT